MKMKHTEKEIMEKPEYEEGRITISRVSCNMEEDYICIDLKHRNERKTTTKIKMNLEDYALLISGLGRVPCNYKTEDYA